MLTIHRRITRAKLASLAAGLFGDLVKGVVDVERAVLVVDMELHADGEALLLEQGSKQEDIWGINLYPASPWPEMLEFDSMINLKPRHGNRSRVVEDQAIQSRIAEIVRARVEVND